MNSSNTLCPAGQGFNRPFSRIYAEREALRHPRAGQILDAFPSSRVVIIDHYKDVFNRSHQSFYLQKHSQALILAVKKGTLIYPGAPFCQDFGNSNFYYTSNIMNCVYDCEYCYLQGMYPSGNLVVFLNLTDTFEEVLKLLEHHPVYLCVSYDTDLLALEGITGFVRDWIIFAKEHPDLKLEIRTKSTAFSRIADLAPCKNVILAWTLSPAAAARYEHNTPSPALRLQSALCALHAGWPVRLCFDPLLLLPDAAAMYREFVEEVFSVLPGDKILDLGVGPFRISAEYLKRIRKSRPDCAILSYPFETAGGVASYDRAGMRALTDYVCGLAAKHMDADKIYRYEEDE